MRELLRRAVRGTLDGAVLGALDSTGALDAAIRRAMARHPLWMVAMYHRVLPDGAEARVDFGQYMPAARFAGQLDFLRTHFEVLPVLEVVARLKAGRPLPMHVASITFDDGYRDNGTVAAQILAARQLPWTLYVTTEGMAEGQPFWWERAIAVLEALPAGPVDLRNLELAQFAMVELVPSTVSRRGWTLSVLERLWKLPTPVALEVLDTLQQYGRGGHEPVPQRLTAEEVLALARSGVEIGSHTHTHQNLAMAPDAAIVADVRKGRGILEEICGAPIGGFAYPGGRAHGGVADVVRGTGCAYAALADGRINVGQVDLYGIRRVGMPNTSLPYFKMILLKHLARDIRGRPDKNKVPEFLS